MRLFFLMLFGFSNLLYGQHFKISGNWLGILTDSTSDFTKNYPILLQIKGINGHATGIVRIEFEGKYSQFEVSGTYKKKKHFTLKSASKAQYESNDFRLSPFEFVFHYDDSSEYVVSTLTSSGNWLHGFKMYLEWEETQYELAKKPALSSIGAEAMAYRIKLGVPAKSKRIKELAVFQFKPIYFEVDRYEIDSSFYPYLEKLTRILNSHSDLRLNIIGHTDADGSNEYNLELSKNRANAIFQHLNGLGIASDRMIFEFEGESRPAETNDNQNGKRRNRRVEFRFI